MYKFKYKIILGNGIVNTTYHKIAFTSGQAIILAKAEAIQNAMGYELVSVEKEG